MLKTSTTLNNLFFLPPFLNVCRLRPTSRSSNTQKPSSSTSTVARKGSKRTSSKANTTGTNSVSSSSTTSSRKGGGVTKRKGSKTDALPRKTSRRRYLMNFHVCDTSTTKSNTPKCNNHSLIAVPSTSNPLSITITPPSQSRLSVDWVPLLVRQRERSFSVLHAPRRKSPLLSESALTWQKQRRGVLSGKGSLGLMIFVIAYKQINTVCIPKLLKTDERIMTFVPDPTSSR